MTLLYIEVLSLKWIQKHGDLDIDGGDVLHYYI